MLLNTLTEYFSVRPVGAQILFFKYFRDFFLFQFSVFMICLCAFGFLTSLQKNKNKKKTDRLIRRRMRRREKNTSGRHGVREK